MGRLIDQFKTLPDDQHVNGWRDLWENDEIGLWDRGRPSPSLVDLLDSHPELFNPWRTTGNRKKFFVPACGRGFDVALASLNGFEAIGLEVSEAATSRARQSVSSELTPPVEGYYSAGANESSLTEYSDVGPFQVTTGDFFERTWETVFNGQLPEIVYDYTFLCALSPNMRAAWATRMAEIIPCGGLLICLEFPLFKDNTEEGPPWGLHGVYWDLLAAGGDGLVTSPVVEEETPQNGQFSRMLRYRPTRQLPQARGTDMISVWKRK